MRTKVIEKEEIDYTWQKDGNCKNYPVELFFPPKGTNKIDPKVIELCSKCPVQNQCYEHAVRHELYGIWAGTSEKERKFIRRRDSIHIHKPESDNWFENGSLGTKGRISA